MIITFPYVSGDEFFHVVDALDGDFALTDHGIVVGVGGDQQSLCNVV